MERLEPESSPDGVVGMKTVTRALWGAVGVLLVLGLLLPSARPSDAGGRGQGAHGGHRHFHGGVFVGVGPWWWWDPYWYYYPPYWYYPPPVVIEQPPVYVQPPPLAAPPSWYYCPSAKAYYPTAPSCPEPWIRVAPRSP